MAPSPPIQWFDNLRQRCCMLRWSAFVWAAVLLYLPIVQLPLPAAEVDGVDAAREAFQAGRGYPWYDSAKDDVRPLKVAPYLPSDDPNRRSHWEYQPPAPGTPAKPATTTATTRGGSFPLFDVFGLSALGLLIVGLCLYLAWAFFREETDESSVAFAGKEPSVGNVDRVSELPLQLGNVRGDFLTAARREYEAGNYSQAVIYLFSYQLLQLDRHQLIRLAKGKTNRQYLREVRPRPELRTVFEQTMLAFEDVFFGKHTLDRERFESCWTRVDDFHRLLEIKQA